jgi:hypothetical protein
MMKDNIDSTGKMRQLSRSKNKRSVSKGHRSSAKLDGIKFIKPVIDKENTGNSPPKSSIIKASSHQNKIANENEKHRLAEESRSPTIEYGQYGHVGIVETHEKDIKKVRSISQRFY